MTAHTYGLEFETIGLSPRASANAITRGGVACHSEDYNHVTRENWKALRDGSLPSNSSEIVSPILTAERLNEARIVTRAMQSAGATTNKYAGFHVHLGADQIGLGSDNLRDLIVNWYTAHNTLASMVAPSRLNARWCKVLDLDSAEHLGDQVHGEDSSRYYDRFDRYYSLNLNSIARHGTIEFRLHQGTLNGTKALAWVEFLTAMVNYSMEGNRLNRDFARPNNPQARVDELPRLLATIREFGITDKAHDYLIRHAMEISARQ